MDIALRKHACSVLPYQFVSPPTTVDLRNRVWSLVASGTPATDQPPELGGAVDPWPMTSTIFPTPFTIPSASLPVHVAPDVARSQAESGMSLPLCVWHTLRSGIVIRSASRKRCQSTSHLHYASPSTENARKRKRGRRRIERSRPSYIPDHD